MAHNTAIGSVVAIWGAPVSAQVRALLFDDNTLVAGVLTFNHGLSEDVIVVVYDAAGVQAVPDSVTVAPGVAVIDLSSLAPIVGVWRAVAVGAS